MKPKHFVERFPVLIYFVLVFVLTWGGVLILASALPEGDALVYLMLAIALWVGVALLAVSQRRTTHDYRPQIEPLS